MAHNIEVHVRLRPVASTSVWTSTVGTLSCHLKSDVTHQFDTVHPMSTNNETLFTSIKTILHAALDGTNTSVMAYGQTGSGKTHSMVGTNSELGIIRRSAEVLLDRVQASNGQMTLKASCIEIYNEKVRDLMTPGSNELEVNQAPDGTVLVDKREVEVRTMEDFMVLWSQADRSRKYGVTDLNAHSSRSHFLITFHIQRGRTNNQLIFVDLAGSESAARAGTHGSTMREGGFINKSLLALGNVVDALADGRVPVYRDSKLTRILSPCLGGKGLTHILCCINPTKDNYEQSSAALRFAQRAKKITSDITTLIGTPPVEFYQAWTAVQRASDDFGTLCAAVRQEATARTYMAVRKSIRTIFDSTGEEAEKSLDHVRQVRLLRLGRERFITLKRLRAEQEMCRVDGREDIEEATETLHMDAERFVSDIEQGREKVRRLEHTLQEERSVLDANAARVRTELDSLGDEWENEIQLLTTEENVGRVSIFAEYERVVVSELVGAHKERMWSMREAVINGAAQVKIWKEQLLAAKHEVSSLEEAVAMAEGAFPMEDKENLVPDVDEVLKSVEPSVQRIRALEEEDRTLDEMLKRKPSIAPRTTSEANQQQPRSRHASITSPDPRTARTRQPQQLPRGGSGRPPTMRSTMEAVRDVQNRFLTAEDRAQLARLSPPRPKTATTRHQVGASPKPKQAVRRAPQRGAAAKVHHGGSITPLRSSMSSTLSKPSPVGAPRAAQPTKSSRAKQKTPPRQRHGESSPSMSPSYPAEDDDSMAARVFRERLAREGGVERNLFSESPMKAPKKKTVAVARTRVR